MSLWAVSLGEFFLADHGVWGAVVICGQLWLIALALVTLAWAESDPDAEDPLPENSHGPF